MNDKLVLGDWINGSVYIDPVTKKTTDDRLNKARFFEHEKEDTFKSTKTNKVYMKIVKCDIRTLKTRDVFSALVKENSDKHLELVNRFPKAWKNFVDKGGGFGEKEVKKEIKSEVEIPVTEKKDISSKAEEIELLKKEYKALEDKRCGRGKEIRILIKYLEG